VAHAGRVVYLTRCFGGNRGPVRGRVRNRSHGLQEPNRETLPLGTLTLSIRIVDTLWMTGSQSTVDCIV